MSFESPEGPFGRKGLMVFICYWLAVILHQFIRAWKKVRDESGKSN